MNIEFLYKQAGCRLTHFAASLWLKRLLKVTDGFFSVLLRQPLSFFLRSLGPWRLFDHVNMTLLYLTNMVFYCQFLTIKSTDCFLERWNAKAKIAESLPKYSTLVIELTERYDFSMDCQSVLQCKCKYVGLSRNPECLTIACYSPTYTFTLTPFCIVTPKCHARWLLKQIQEFFQEKTPQWNTEMTVMMASVRRRSTMRNLNMYKK